MATLNLKLDTKRKLKGDLCPVRLVFRIGQNSAFITLEVRVKEADWDFVNKFVLPSDKKFKIKNQIIQSKYDAAEKFINDLILTNRLPDNPIRIRDMFGNKDKRTTFIEYLNLFIAKKEGKTKECYLLTRTKIIKHFGKDVYFQDITKSWLEKFDKECEEEGNKVNTRSVYMRNIRTVFNDAIDNDLISLQLYPFRKFKIKNEEPEKRSIRIEDFVKIVNFKGSKTQNWARDMFLLSFLLIGINMKDLYGLKEIENGYITYRRAKTKRIYKIKVESEAALIIKKHKGEKGLICASDKFKLSKSFMIKVNKYLKSIADELNIPIFTTYSARHSWASYASELGISQDIIAKALGHGKKTVTDGYITFNMQKVEEANMAVLKYAFRVIYE